MEFFRPLEVNRVSVSVPIRPGNPIPKTEPPFRLQNEELYPEPPFSNNIYTLYIISTFQALKEELSVTSTFQALNPVHYIRKALKNKLNIVKIKLDNYTNK